MSKRYDVSSFKIKDITNYAKIFRKGDSDVFYVDATLEELTGKLRRFERSTKLTNRDKALAKAKEMINDAYEHRTSYGEIERTMPNKTLFLKFTKWMHDQQRMGNPMKQGGTWNKDNLKKYNGMLWNHIAPVLGDKPLKNTTELDLEKVVNKMREKGLSEKTISNCRTGFYYLWSYALARGTVGKAMPKFPPIKPTQYTDTGVKQSHGHATPKMVKDAIKKLEKHLKNTNSLTKVRRHQLYVFIQWFKLLADTGIRPYFDTPLPLVEKDRNEKEGWITFARNEKRIPYVAEGTATSIDIVDELNAYYKEMGIDNKELIVNWNGEPFTENVANKVWDKKGDDNCITKIIDWGKNGKIKDEWGRNLVPYSIRHMHITHAIEQKDESLIDIVERCGTSIEQVERTYYTKTPKPRNSPLN